MFSLPTHYILKLGQDDLEVKNRCQVVLTKLQYVNTSHISLTCILPSRSMIQSVTRRDILLTNLGRSTPATKAANRLSKPRTSLAQHHHCPVQDPSLCERWVAAAGLQGLQAPVLTASKEEKKYFSHTQLYRV